MTNTNDLLIKNLNEHALNMRKTSLKLAYLCGKNVHIGGALSMMDALAVLYGEILNVTQKDLAYGTKDKFILSKGHAVLGLYAALYEFNIIDEETLHSFLQNGSALPGHPVMNLEIGIEASSGSLGQGIAMAVGLALAAKRKGYSYKTYVICGNGECNEGSVWEACMSAVNYKLDNLTIFVDNNHMQSDGMSSNVLDVSDKYAAMFTGLGFQVFQIDGNNIKELYDVFHKSMIPGCPKVIIGNTIKGKGISFMENNNEWHHNRLIEEKYAAAMMELEHD